MSWGRGVGLALGLVAGAAAHGATEGDGEFYVKLSTGVGLTSDSDLSIHQPGRETRLIFHDVAWEDHSLRGPDARYSDVRFGYFLAGRPWLGLAVDFLHYKVFARVEREAWVTGTHLGAPLDALMPIGLIVQRYEITNGVNLLPLSVIARRPRGRVRPYGGLGAGPTWLYTKSTIDGAKRSGPYEFGNVAFQAIAGVQCRVSRRWDLFVEAKLTRTRADGKIPEGSSTTDLDSRHVTAGAGVHW